MAITRNKKLLWVGPKPDPGIKVAFTARDYHVDHFQYGEFCHYDESVINAICRASTVFFVHNAQKPKLTFDFITRFSELPISYSGTFPCVFVETANVIPIIIGNPNVKDVLAKQGIKWIDAGANQDHSRLAQEIIGLPFGRPPNLDLEIHGNVGLLDDSQKVLLQRSFSDCCSLTVREMKGGFSAKVVKVFAEFGQTGDATHSVPFFVKFDKLEDVQTEIVNFAYYVDNYVPFNLRPAINLSRCVYEQVWYRQKWGIIVASYVDRAIPLLEAVARGSGPAAIHSLFEETLGRWIFNTRRETAPLFLALQKGNPKTDRFSIDKFSRNADIIKKARALSRRVLAPDDLLRAIENVPCDNYLYGTCHRDLHAKNVLVRGNDAVIIDFPKCDKGPVLLDLATMDVSIAFDSMPRESARSKEWKSFVKDLYCLNYVYQVPPLKNAYEPFYNQWSCIRQIRRLALLDQKDRNEYAICLAMELLRRSMFGDEHPRAAGCAYYLADQLVKSLARAVSPKSSSKGSPNDE